MKTSFAPKDAGTARWDGGPATITNPRFQYRKVDFGRGEEQMITLHVDYVTPDGGEHEGRFDVGNKQTSQGADLVVIRESADDGADEAEVGPSFSHVDPDSSYRVSPKSEFYAFTSALAGAGFSESKLASGDIGVIDGVEVIVKPTARKEGDRFPLLLPVELQNSKKAAAKPTAKAAKPVAKKPEPEPEPEEEETGEGDQELEPSEQAALDFIIELDKPVKIAAAVSKASSSIKDKKMAAQVIKLLQSAAFHERFSGYWSYDAKTKTIKEA